MQCVPNSEINIRPLTRSTKARFNVPLLGPLGFGRKKKDIATATTTSASDGDDETSINNSNILDAKSETTVIFQRLDNSKSHSQEHLPDYNDPFELIDHSKQLRSRSNSIDIISKDSLEISDWDTTTIPKKMHNSDFQRGSDGGSPHGRNVQPPRNNNSYHPEYDPYSQDEPNTSTHLHPQTHPSHHMRDDDFLSDDAMFEGDGTCRPKTYQNKTKNKAYTQSTPFPSNRDNVNDKGLDADLDDWNTPNTPRSNRGFNESHDHDHNTRDRTYDPYTQNPHSNMSHHQARESHLTNNDKFVRNQQSGSQDPHHTRSKSSPPTNRRSSPPFQIIVPQHMKDKTQKQKLNNNNGTDAQGHKDPPMTSRNTIPALPPIPPHGNNDLEGIEHLPTKARVQHINTQPKDTPTDITQNNNAVAILQQLVESLQTLTTQATDRNNNHTNNPQAGTRWYSQQAPVFCGRYDEDFMKFRLKADIYFQFLGLNGQKKLASLPMLLDNRAFSYFNEIDPKHRQTYESAMSKLEAKFGPTSKNCLFQTSILNFTQGSTSVADYSSKIIDKMAMLKIQDEGQKLNIFLRGLNPEIAASVILMKPTDINEAENCAILTESSLLLKQSKHDEQLKTAMDTLASVIKEKSTDNTKANVQSVEKKQTDNTHTNNIQPMTRPQAGRGRGQYGPRPQHFGNNQNTNQPRGPNPPFPHQQHHNDSYYNQQGYGPRNANSQNRFPAPRQNRPNQGLRLCYRCQADDHLIRDCPVPPYPRQDRPQYGQYDDHDHYGYDQNYQ